MATVRYVREIVGPSDTMLKFETEIDGVQVNGVDIIHQRMAVMLQANPASARRAKEVRE